jgi:hypothetical protein
MENAKQQLVERLKEANNVLVTVSTNPSVDQLAAAIGLTLLLNKLDKHATAVFSGEVPSTIEFLQPDETIEKNTDSLRDFIISLDKSKADKLRYKVEDKMVKIFITPYHTSITDADLEFSHGDFNVDAVVAIGVHAREELDQAIIGHGRILHDATAITVNTQPGSELGTINWVDQQASSLCEMLVAAGQMLKNDVFDAQMSTAFLTGIVAETDRFSNARTTSDTMSISAKLMAAGANQQLVATKLQTPTENTPAEAPVENSDNPMPIPEEGEGVDGSLQVDHEEEPATEESSVTEEPEPVTESEEELPQPKEPPAPASPVNGITMDEHGVLHLPDEPPGPKQKVVDPLPPTEELPAELIDEPETSGPQGPKPVFEPPTFGGKLTANSEPEHLDPSTDPLSLPPPQPLLSHDSPAEESPASEEPTAPPLPLPPEPQPTAADLLLNPTVITPDPAAQQPEPTAPELPEPESPLTAAKREVQKLSTPSERSIQDTHIPEPTSEVPLVPAAPAEPQQTLADIEESVDSPHTHQVEAPARTSAEPPAPAEPKPAVDEARNAVHAALNAPDLGSTSLEPLQALNAMPIDENLNAAGDGEKEPDPPATVPESTAFDIDPQTGEIKYGVEPSGQDFSFPEAVPTTAPPEVSDPTAPPPVPPPMMPPLGDDDQHIDESEAGAPPPPIF